MKGYCFQKAWLENITFPDSTARRKRPSEVVHLSKVVNTADSESPTPVGNILCNSTLEFQPDYELETF
jgi:hypothetical protein